MVFYFLTILAVLFLFFTGFLCGRYVLITKYRELVDSCKLNFTILEDKVLEKAGDLQIKQERLESALEEYRKGYAEFIPLLQRFRVIVETYPENYDKPNVDQFFRSFSTCYTTSLYYPER